jgi:LysM repeat protein
MRLMKRNRWVLLVSLLLLGMIVACLNTTEEDSTELQPTFILTPYATVTPTPTVTPPVPSTPTPSPTPETDIYVVVPGDTLSGIAEQFGISTQELMSLNGLSTGDILSVGQELRVPK